MISYQVCGIETFTIYTQNMVLGRQCDMKGKKALNRKSGNMAYANKPKCCTPDPIPLTP